MHMYASHNNRLACSGKNLLSFAPVLYGEFESSSDNHNDMSGTGIISGILYPLCPPIQNRN